jgi:exopolysaccharide biosynthesis polyprenyl glycosylphosphotransferase
LEPDYFISTIADAPRSLGDAAPSRVRPHLARRPDSDTSDANGLSVAWKDGAPLAAKPTGARRASLAIKRVIDIVVSSLALIAIGPLLLFTALAIRLTSEGPILFRQTRIGHLGKPFTIYKFRSMYIDKCDAPGSIQAIPGDTRVTPVGRFIRKTSIDELPQLFNVLRGDMSLVGPRPYVAEMLAAGELYNQIVPWFDYRHLMTPGITGWAQANGLRGPTTSHGPAVRRVEYDVAYIQNFSLALDLKIVLMTVWRELTGGSGV